ncbi:MAG: BamA/OMP85 family outer membrane protein [Vicinamibacterales bacterium]
MARFVLATVVLGAFLAAPARRDDGEIKVESLTFNGVESIDEGQLRNVLQTKKGSWLPWGRQRYFDRRAFESDLKRIQAFYHDRGFPDARVTSFDVTLNDRQDEVDLTINISEGDAVRIAEIRLEGFDVLPEDTRATIREQLPLAPEQPFDRQLAVTARERSVNVLRDHGYPYAEVTLAEEPAGPRRVVLGLRATPGPLAYFGPVEISGQASVGDHVIRRQITYEPGELFRRSAMRESQRKLYQLELFEFVNIDSREDRERKPTTIPTRVTVAEGKHRKVNVGVGYGTEEQARVRLRWDHVNFFGGARHAGFEGKWSSLDRGVRVDLREPYFFHPDFSLELDGQAWQASERAYAANTVGGRLTGVRQANTRDRWGVSLINEYQRSRISNEALTDLTLRDELISLGLDPRTGQQDGTLSAVAFDIRRDTSDNVLDARRGYYVAGYVEQAGRWMWGNFNYVSVLGEARHYLSLGRRMVIANRLRMGTIDPVDNRDDNVPFNKRYFLGGSTSMRGWGRFELSPLSGFGLPVGGLSMVDGSAEVRTAVWGKVGLVAFLDYGNVWDEGWEFDLGDLRYAVGPGLRYLTPIGPTRFDFGYQVNPLEGLLVNGEPQKRRWRIHFSIGQAF